ncbi:NAD-dependent epimerase/dehydratase family protein [Sphingomonas sp.]|uniref:NAD-dependent epimerase/dehydratase family protein n=1 Tax=Sphingomonas sp. TaxID=28214 RepID=UPI0017F5764E|nr:NAD-dependent epimerase/dehydratase family protein [Sphingomonas sp.]MBA3511782.1 NAD(P)H-binding protein [Sphingomonas sp.]
MKLAVTGGTGFVGSRLLDAAVADGHQVSALTRRPLPARVNVDWVSGSLEEPVALAKLVAGADSVIHVAGVISGRTAADFDRCNVDGTQAMLVAAKASGVKRFVHVSSLAAREPNLSLYGASKAKSEQLVANSGLPFAIVRPPAVYGPGDKETLELFKMAKLGFVLLPPEGRLSLLHADDLVRLLLALAATGAPSGVTIEPDDGRTGAWSHKEFAEALGTAVGRRGLSFSIPSGLLRLGARADRLLRGDKAKLTTDRAAYFCHPDWVVDAAHAAPADLWQPRIATPDGLTATAQWYRAQGWL